MDQSEILSQIRPTFLKLREIIDANRDFFNRPPSYGGWTPGQCTRHIQMYTNGIATFLQAPGNGKRQPANEKVKQLSSIFLDYNTSYQAPAFIDPEDKEFDPARFQDYFRTLETDLGSAVKDLEMDEVCARFELPGIGPMTRLEFLAFTLFHTQRHIRQMEKMTEDFNASTF